MSAIQYVKILEKYADTHWMMADTYNSLIEGLAKQFELFTPKELASICSSLAKVGLRQDDILNQTVQRVKELATREESHIKSTFNKLIVPLFRAYIDLNLHNEENSEFKKLYDDEYVKEACIGKTGFFEQAKKDTVNRTSLLASIIKGNLDKQDPKFKELVRVLIF